MADDPKYQPAFTEEWSRQLSLMQGLLSSGKQPTTIRPVGHVGDITTYSVQTYRRIDRNEEGRVTKTHDTIFLEIGTPDGRLTRIVLPPAVVTVIHRHDSQMTSKFKRIAAKAAAVKRKLARRAEATT